MASSRTLRLDLKAYDANQKLVRNVLAVSSGVTQEEGLLDERTFSLGSSNSLTVPAVLNTKAVILFSKYPVTITTQLESNAPITLTNQTLFVTTTEVGSIQLSNSGSKTTTVTVIRLADSGDQIEYLIPNHLVTFSTLSRIAPIGYSVTDISNVLVQDITLVPLTNDQVSAPSNVAGDTFRICDSDGTPNPTGAYLMYLDDTVTQQNFSGTLQLWVAETA